MMKRGLLGRLALGASSEESAGGYGVRSVSTVFCHMPEHGIHVAGAVGCATGSSSAAQGCPSRIEPG